MNNKLFLTFITFDNIDSLINKITTNYIIKHNKIFVLKIKDSEEYACTYNIDSINLDNIFPDTIIVHRKKESNSLYTINALNELIKKLNNGIVDTKFPINWNHYKNTILLTQQDELKQLKTKIYKIVEL